MSKDTLMLKISGEQLGSDEVPFSMDAALRIAEVIKRLREQDHHVACVIGGGNVMRGPSLAREGFPNPVVADHIGMLATIQNALFLNQVLLDSIGENTSTVMSNIHSDTLVEPFSYRRAQKAIGSGKTLLIAGGTGKPGFSSDMGVVVQAYELHCPIIVKTTKVDGIYDKDPAKFDEAKRVERVSFDDAINDPDIRVMDKAAIALAAEKGIKIAICQPIPEHVLAVINDDTEFGSIIE